MNICVGHSFNLNAESAVDELAESLHQDNIKLALFFASPEYSPEEISFAFRKKFPQSDVVGCSAAGVICSQGFVKNGIVGASFAGADFRCAVSVIENANTFNTGAGIEAVINCGKSLDTSPEKLSSHKHLAITLIDGASQAEETIISTLALAAPQIKIIGGSVSDFRQFSQTYISHNGAIYRNAAVLLLLELNEQFTVFSQHHFIPTDNEVVISKSSLNQRSIREIDGLPAAERYAQLLNVELAQLTNDLVIQHPFGYKIDDKYYIRSVISAEDGHLRTASAINDGTVLTIMKPGDIIGNTREMVEQIRKNFASPHLLLLFNCLGRYEETEAKGITKDIHSIVNFCPLIGFNTYGEQFASLHINHSITGAAF